VYLPPVQNLQKRGINEDVARSYVEDILSHIPSNGNTVICGDWNTRIGELAPQIGDEVATRKSMDKITNARAPWLINICEQWEWQVLNGMQPGPPAEHTFARGTDRSVIDLIISSNTM
jgi:hypothetical protein